MKKINSYFKLMATLVVPLALTAGFSGCSDKENTFDAEDFSKKLEAFNFKTSAPVTLSVDLGSAAAKEVVAIYPTEVDVISANMHKDMLYNAFTDANGSLKTDIELPAAINKVWIVSLTKPSLGVMTAEVQNGKLTVTSTQGAQARRAATDANTTIDDDGNITTVQSDGSSLTLFNIDNYATVHESGVAMPEQHVKQGYTTLSTVSKSEMGTFWCIDRWMPTKYPDTTYRFGKTGNENGLITNNATIGEYAGILFDEQQTWRAANSSSFKELDASAINQTMKGDTIVVENADGSITTTTYSGSELWVTFIYEGATYQNTFGYYIYKTDEEPKTEAEGWPLERIVIWPSVSSNSTNPYLASSTSGGSTSIYSGWAPLSDGDRVQLLFKDPETGAISKIFPPGYTVGFWFCADAYDPGWNTNGSTCSNLSTEYTSVLNFTQNSARKDPWRPTKKTNSYFGHSNPLINNSSLKAKVTTRFVQYNTKLLGEEFTLYAIEDGGDTNFNDMLFALSRTDYTEVTNSNSEVKLYSEKKYHTVATYAFEDQWPTGGDFDMNDVIVEHDQLQTYTENNYVHSVRDKFTIVSTLDAASNHNAFYVQFPEGQEGNTANLKVTVDGVEMPNRWEAATNSVIVFTDQREAISTGKKEVVVTRDLAGTQYEVGHLEYHPYLIANAISADGESQIGEGRTEIHIPGQEITSLGKTLEVDGAVNTNYYASQFVSDGSEYPFAMGLSGVADWRAPDPGVRIDQTFEKYSSWRAAKGFADMDWYYNKKGWDNRY